MSELDVTRSTGSLHRTGSLRRRVDWAISVVFIAVIVALTAASAVVARREVFRGEQLHAAALLDHLTGMSIQSEDQLRSEIAKMSSYLTGVGASIALVDSRDAINDGLAVERPLVVAGARRMLRYTVSNERVARLNHSIVWMHLMAGLLALAVMVIAVEWTLRRRLLAPIESFRKQLDSLAAEGWSTPLPEVDTELADLRRSLSNVGPALTARTLEWFRDGQKHESAAAVMRIRDIVEERAPLVIERIERIAGGRISVLSLNEAYAAEEEILVICSALAELQAIIDSPAPAREGHA